MQAWIAAADPAVLAQTPREQGMKLYTQATKMFEDQDFVAAAVTFGQAAQLLSRVDRDDKGEVIDKDAHTFRNAALSNKATAYSRAGLYVEASAAFTDVRTQLDKELTDPEKQRLDEAIARIEERIGTIVLSGLPDEELEVRLDGRFERRPLDKPLRMGEGKHSIEVKATGYKPYVADIEVHGKQETPHPVTLVPLDTPAKLRVESTVERTSVEIDGKPSGTAPIEVSVKPGKHRVRVTAESYVAQDSEVDVKPGERAILRTGLVRARAPLGLRIQPEFLPTLPGRTDTPFGKYQSSIGLSLFHDLLRIRTLRFGVQVVYSPRELNSVATGMIETWCPDATAWKPIAWCPVNATASYVFGGEQGDFSSGQARGRGYTAFEYRRGAGFVRAGIGLVLEDYRKWTTDGETGERLFSTFLMLWSASYELSVGLDL
jgi:hypothetical protein